MRGLLALALALVAIGCTAPGPPDLLLGTWRSHEALTLQQLDQSDLTEKQERILREPGFFGDLILTWEPGRLRSLYQGEGGWIAYDTVATGADWVEIEQLDVLTGELERLRIRVSGDQLWIPVRGLGFHEVFVRCAAPGPEADALRDDWDPLQRATVRATCARPGDDPLAVGESEE